MKVRFLDQLGNKIEIGGEIDKNFTIAQGKTISFAEGTTFQGKTIKSVQELYNKDAMSMKIGQSTQGNLVLVSVPIFKNQEEYASTSIVNLEEEEDELQELESEELEDELPEIESEEDELPEIEPELEEDEFNKGLENIFNRYEDLKTKVSQLESNNAMLEGLIAKAKQGLPELFLVKLEPTESDSDSEAESESDSEDTDKFDKGLELIYNQYNTLEEGFTRLQEKNNTLKNELEKINIIIAQRDLQEDTDSGDEAEEEEDLQSLSEQYKYLQEEIFKLKAENTNLTALLSLQRAKDEPSEAEASFDPSQLTPLIITNSSDFILMDDISEDSLYEDIPDLRISTSSTPVDPIHTTH
jgi:chromosome segregation ATPase